VERAATPSGEGFLPAAQRAVTLRDGRPSRPVERAPDGRCRSVKST